MNETLLQGLKFGLKTLNVISPRLSARWAFDLFVTPRRFPRPGWEEELLCEAKRSGTLDGMRYWSWGQGPQVLLVHGWEGRGSQLGAFVRPLVQAGFSVVTFDGPAHGDSAGTRTNMNEFAGKIRLIEAELGPFYAIIAHSFGGGASLRALDQGLETSKLILIASTARLRAVFERFYEQLDLPTETRRQIEVLTQLRVGLSVDEFQSRLLAPREQLEVFVVHDQGDKEVPCEEGRELQGLSPRSEFLETRGLGHRRILKSEDVIKQSLEFLKRGLS